MTSNSPAPDFRLEGKTALVTGAGSGIGRAVALAVAASGAAVACVDLSEASASETAQTIVDAGGRAISVVAEVTIPGDLVRAVERTEAELGPLSLAVNAAGIANGGNAETMPPEQWQRVVDVDLSGVFYSCQAEAVAMLRNGGGAIVNIASMSATIANRGLYQAHYNAAKAGVVQMGRSLAWEWAEGGIRVNSISPGYTYTGMTKRPEQIDAMEGYAADTPMGRNAQPEDIAGPVVFLLSEAAGYVTGVDLLVDGGFVIW